GSEAWTALTPNPSKRGEDAKARLHRSSNIRRAWVFHPPGYQTYASLKIHFVHTSDSSIRTGKSCLITVRNFSNARLNLDLTVPSATCSASAVSLTERSRK